ncbi:TetR family transcriptional regulator [Actinocorallia herbida]|uniref:TetR family transcriptional regulator n=1 Tax=Actinocorallia herbida TaxID=58109 RepID=A0A3N1CZR5_9ACTN|nr:TetR/AcrR family transcriptional regulator [Actinocorallia herbida]ROO86775.1 TetR family transcriptional regulator [Actinocorallia herbida]
MTPTASAPAPEDPPRGAARSPRSGYAKGRARQTAIIRTAAEYFAHKGFSAATILDIAAACGISRAGLLHYFPDKEALLQAVLEDRDTEDRERFRPYARIPDGLGVLRGMVDLAQHNQLVPGLIELFVRLSAEASDPDHPARPYFAARYARIQDGTALALRRAREAGHVRPAVDPVEAAVRLTALMDGLQAQWLLNRDIAMADHVHTAVLELLTPTGTRTFDALRLPPPPAPLEP